MNTCYLGGNYATCIFDHFTPLRFVLNTLIPEIFTLFMVEPLKSQKAKFAPVKSMSKMLILVISLSIKLSPIFYNKKRQFDPRNRRPESLSLVNSTDLNIRFLI